jgi:hypothetical protein
MKRTMLLILLSVNFISYAQDPPRLEFFCTLNVTLEPPLVVGETPHGTRRIIPIIGGTVEGPSIKGEIIKGGADWQIVRKDGVSELEAHYQFKTDDGVIVYVKNIGVRVASPEIAAKIARGEHVDAGQYYFRAVPKFEAPAGKYAWINDSIFICTGERLRDSVVLRVWKVL